MLVFEKAILAVEGIWEVRCRKAIVLGEAEICRSTFIDTSVQVRFI